MAVATRVVSALCEMEVMWTVWEGVRCGRDGSEATGRSGMQGLADEWAFGTCVVGGGGVPVLSEHFVEKRRKCSRAREVLWSR